MSLANTPQNDPYEPFDVLNDLAMDALAQSNAGTLTSAKLSNAIDTLASNIQPPQYGIGLNNNTSNNPLYQQQVNPLTAQQLQQMGTFTGGSTYAYTTTAPGQWTVSGTYGSDIAETPPDTNLGSLIARCGNGFYYLVSPFQTGDNTWHAKGRRAIGKGATAEEAVEQLLQNLTPEEE